MKTTTDIGSIDDVKAAMGRLYAQLRDGEVELKTAAELANIAGKYLKGEQLQLAREIFQNNIRRVVTPPPASEAGKMP